MLASYDPNLPDGQQLVDAFVGNRELVKAWEALSDYQDLRINTDFLESISDDLTDWGYSVSDVIKYGINPITEVSDDILKSNSTVYALYKRLVDEGKLTWVEASALFRYTYYDPIGNISGSSLVNPVLPAFPDRYSAGQIISSALRKLGESGYYLPEGTITTRGGCYTNQRMVEDFINHWKDKTPTSLPVVLSSSTDNTGNVAKKFIDRTFDGSNIRTIITIKTKKGIYIDDFAHWGSNFNETSNPGIKAEPDLPHPQFEVLHLPGTQFKVVDIVDDYNSAWYPGELLKKIVLEEL